MHVGDGASVELVDKFCYVGDMLSVDGDADAAVKARVCKGWNTRNPAIAEGPRDAGVPVEIW